MCPGINDGAVLDDTLLGVLDRFPRAGDRRGRPAGRQRRTPPSPTCARTRRRRRARCSTSSSAWQDAVRGRARAPARVRRRRVLPARGAAVPRAATRTRGSRSTRTASAWRAPSRTRSGGPSPVLRSRPPAPAPGFFAWVDGAPADGLPRAANDPCAIRPDRTQCTTNGAARPIASAHRRVRRAGARAAAARTRRGRVGAACGSSPVPNRFFGGNIGVTGLLTGADVAAVAHRRADRRALPAARRRALRGPLPRRHDRRRPAAPGRGRADRRRRARRRASAEATVPEPLVAVVGDPTSASRRSSTGSSGGATRSSRSTRASPATARSSSPTGTGAASASSTPGAGVAERPSAPAGAGEPRRPSGRWPKPTSSCSSSTPPWACVEEDAQVAAPAPAVGQARAARGEQGRRRRPRDRRVGVRSARARRPDRGVGDPRAGERRPARRDRGRAAGRSPRLPEAPDADDAFAVAVVGRPNVGKSTLFNRLVGDERSVVHDQPGTTRDTIDTVVETEDGPLRFVDTAGMRRRSRVDEPTEYYGLVRALQAVDRADAALLVIDASEGVTHQDQRLAERVDAAGTAIVVVLNKWDLLDAEQRDRVEGRARRPARRSWRTRRSSRSPRSPAATSAGCSPRSARPRRRTTSGCRPPRSTGCIQAAQRSASRRRSSGSAAHACCTRPRARPTRRRSRCSAPTSCRRPTCATSSAASARRSSSGPTPVKMRVRRRSALSAAGSLSR